MVPLHQSILQILGKTAVLALLPLVAALSLLPPRVPDLNPDSIDKKELLAKADTKCQDFVESKMPGFAQDDQKGLTQPWTIVHDQTYHYQGFIRKITKYI